MRASQMKVRSGAPIAVAVLLALVVQATPAWAAAPSNDDVANATPVPAVPFTDVTDTTEATPEATDGSCSGSGPSVWYAITVPSTTYIEVNTAGSAYDTTLHAFTGSVGSLELLACNDDYYGLQSRLGFEAVGGETYHVMVGSYAGGAGGPMTLNVFETEPPPPPFDLAFGSIGGSANGKTGVATIRGTITCNSDGSYWIEGRLRQRVGRLILLASWSASGECTGGSAVFQAPAVSDGGLFTSGAATVEGIYLEGCNATSCDTEYPDTVSIKLKGSR